MSKNVTVKDAEKAVADYIKAKQTKKSAEAIMKSAEETIEQYGRENIDQFTDNRLSCGLGIIQIKAGVAKPVKNGVALSTSQRGELATKLPDSFVKISPDFTMLFSTDNAKVRQLLKAEGISIVREDRFAVV